MKGNMREVWVKKAGGGRRLISAVCLWEGSGWERRC